MKSLAIATLLLGNAVTAPFDTIRPREIKKSKMGAVEVVDYFETGMKKKVNVPSKPFHMDYN